MSEMLMAAIVSVGAIVAFLASEVARDAERRQDALLEEALMGEAGE